MSLSEKEKFFRGASVSIYFLLSTMFLLGAVLINRFPLTHFGDTSVYIFYGFSKTHPAGTHSFFYGLWIYFASLSHSLWFTAFFQALIVTFCIIECVYNFTSLNYRDSYRYSFIVIILLSFTTSITKYAGMIMPDIFTSILICITALLFLGKKLSSVKRILFVVLLILSISFHSSHILSFTIFLSLFGLFYYLFYRKSGIIATKTFVVNVAIIFASFLVIPFGHLAYTGKFYLSKSSQTFLIGRLAEIGVLDDFLDEHCAEKNYSLCGSQGKIKGIQDFLWDMSSPLYKNGDLFSAWENTREEYSGIVTEFLKQPKYVIRFITEGFKSTFIMLVNFNLYNDNVKMDRIANDIQTYIPGDSKGYLSSGQANGWFFYNYDKVILDRSYLTTIIFTFFLLAIISLNHRLKILNPFSKILLAIFLIWIFVNAMTCATFSGVFPRYQERVVWLIPFITFLISFDYFKNIFKVIINKIKILR